MKTGYDASTPPANPPTVDVVAFYGGGDTPHVWTLEEINASPCRYRLPIYVRSDPTAASPNVDAATFIKWLSSVGAPPGSSVVLDLETAISTSYVNAFGALLRDAGYLVLPYGSSGNLFANPQLDGYWVDLPGADAIPSNCVGVQYAQGGGGSYDLSWWEDSVVFWDTKPSSKENDMICKLITKKGTNLTGQINGEGQLYVKGQGWITAFTNALLGGGYDGLPVLYEWGTSVWCEAEQAIPLGRVDRYQSNDEGKTWTSATSLP